MKSWLVTFERSASLKTVHRALAYHGCHRAGRTPIQHGDPETMIMPVVGPDDLDQKLASLGYIRAVTEDTNDSSAYDRFQK